MPYKPGSPPHQNGLAVALREPRHIERTMFIWDWQQNVELRRRAHAGLNKEEARNALVRAVLIHRRGGCRYLSLLKPLPGAEDDNFISASLVKQMGLNPALNTERLQAALAGALRALRSGGRLAR